jgi:hypothetical protein
MKKLIFMKLINSQWISIFSAILFTWNLVRDWCMNLHQIYRLHFAAGYELERDAKLKGIENKNLILINQNNSYVRTNWSGFRLHAGIGFKPGSLPFLRRAPGVTN